MTKTNPLTYPNDVSRLVQFLVDYILNCYSDYGRADESFVNEECVKLGGAAGLGTQLLDAFENVPVDERMAMMRPQPFDANIRPWLLETMERLGAPTSPSPAAAK